MKKPLLITAVIILCLSVLGAGGITWHANSIIKGIADVKVRTTEALLDVYSSEIEQIHVKSPDKLSISAWHFAKLQPKGVVIVLHGMHGMDASSMLHEAKFFNSLGYTAIAVDLRAHGHSDGNKISFGYHEVGDVSAILDWVAQNSEYAGLPIVLYGHSMGASVAIRTAAARSDVSLVVSVAAYESIEQQIADYMRQANLPKVLVNTYLPFFKLILRATYGVNPAKSSPMSDIAKLSPRPILLIHGDVDDQTDVLQARNLWAKAGEVAELWVVEGSGHSIVEGNLLEEQNAWYRDRIADFLHRHLE
ncbi:MAG: hypothetical protein FD169_2498 [Bacillota bacterium]|nr:MAG: hypothetical protein FD169_2498 [Bacillota bacterium]